MSVARADNDPPVSPVKDTSSGLFDLITPDFRLSTVLWVYHQQGRSDRGHVRVSAAGALRGLETSVRVLAIDFGMRRMGLAVSDARGIIAQGLPTLPRTRLDDDLRKIQELTEAYSTGRVIVGNPLGHGGGETTMSRHAAEFAEKLRRRVNCPVTLWDERLTSVQANRALRATGLSPGKRQRAVDRVAATLLLQSYLDFLSNERNRNAKVAP